jgi:molybdenum cofactor synthesis domain-containing protein
MFMSCNAWIVSIGNELLIGRIVNTNAAWLCRKLLILGFSVKRVLTIPDSEEDIVEVVRECVGRRVRVLILTGGLGPTYDDITSESLAKALGRGWEVNSEAYSMVVEKYRSRGFEITSHRVKLAKMPSNSKPLPNPIGTAPGIFTIEGDTYIFALPGIPSEMEAMFNSEVEKILREIGSKTYFIEGMIIVEGVPESAAAPIIDKCMKKHGGAYIKSHPKGFESSKPVLDIRVLIGGVSIGSAEAECSEIVGELSGELVRIGGLIRSTSIQHLNH